MSRLDPVDRARCAELALVPGRPFDIALRFTDAATADRALALEALFAVLRELPFSVSDPAPGLAQLAWWQAEIAQAGTRGSQHPVVRALRDSGAIEALREDAWGDHLREIGAQLGEGPAAFGEELVPRLETVARREALLLGGFEAADPGVQGLGAHMAQARMLGLLVRLAPGVDAPAWVPASLRTRATGADQHRDHSALVAALARFALERAEAVPPLPESRTPAQRVVAVHCKLSGRQLRRLRNDPGRRHAHDADRLGPLDVLRAWRWSRRRLASA